VEFISPDVVRLKGFFTILTRETEGVRGEGWEGEGIERR
jgi:hypothetical protein